MTIDAASPRPSVPPHARAVRPLALAIAALGLGTSFAFTAPASAESLVNAGAEPARIETMVVIGSRGRERSVTETAVPVDVIDASQLASAGAFGGEFGQALQTLAPSFNFQRQSNSGSADLVRPAQLRGMSPDQTLVLMNSKRRHTTSITGIDAKVGRGTAPVDFNSIPGSAISRIEVLRDGAGSQYGSDAVAGVVNVMLDERPEGLDLGLSYGGHRTDFDPIDDDITDGETTALTASWGMPIGSGGFLRLGGEYKQREETDRGGRGEVPFFEDSANVGGRQFKPGDGETEDRLLWVNVGLPLDENTEVYGFSTYSQRDAEGTGFFRYPVSSQNILSVYPNGFRPVTTGDNTDIAITGGLRGDADEWNWDASVSWGQNEFDGGVKGSLNPSLGPTSPRVFESGSTENSLFSLNLDIDRPLELGFVAPATLALGAEYRRENFQSFAGDPLSYTAGAFADAPDFLSIGAQAGGGLRPEEERDLDRHVVSVYGEISADISESLFVDVSTRFEHPDDFDNTLSGKVAARWEFVAGWALRGSVSNSFRAPSLVQIGFGTSSTSFGAGGQLTTVNTLPVDDVVARALGAEDLEEETAVNYSIGLTGQPIDGMVLTIDLFRIDVDDRITLSERIDCVAEDDEEEGEITAEAVSDATAALCAGRNITAANFFTNAVDTRTEGLDVVLTYATEAFAGKLDLSAAYSYAKTEIEDVNTAANPDVILVGVEESNTIEDAAPRDKIVLSADWNTDRVGALVRLTRWGEATRVFNFGGGFEPEQTYDRVWQLDAEARVTVFEGVELFVGANNLLDEYPDESIADISYFGNLPYDVLSPVGMNGRFVYGGLRAKL